MSLYAKDKDKPEPDTTVRVTVRMEVELYRRLKRAVEALDKTTMIKELWGQGRGRKGCPYSVNDLLVWATEQVCEEIEKATGR